MRPSPDTTGRLCLTAAVGAEAGATLELSDDRAHYLTRVLRLKAGGRVLCFDGSGREWEAVLEPQGGRRWSLRLASLIREEEAPTPLVLVQAWLKGGALDTVVQKTTELGVSEICLIPTERANASPRSDRLDNKLRHLERIAVSASEQCGRLHLPRLITGSDLGSELCRPQSQIFFLDPGARPLDPASSPVPTTLIVGPEGGWSEAERALAERSEKVTRAGLGTLILRAETAPLAAIAGLRAMWGWRS